MKIDDIGHPNRLPLSSSQPGTAALLHCLQGALWGLAIAELTAPAATVAMLADGEPAEPSLPYTRQLLTFGTAAIAAVSSEQESKDFLNQHWVHPAGLPSAEPPLAGALKLLLLTAIWGDRPAVQPELNQGRAARWGEADRDSQTLIQWVQTAVAATLARPHLTRGLGVSPMPQRVVTGAIATPPSSPSPWHQLIAGALWCAQYSQGNYPVALGLSQAVPAIAPLTPIAIRSLVGGLTGLRGGQLALPLPLLGRFAAQAPAVGNALNQLAKQLGAACLGVYDPVNHPLEND